MKDLNNGVYRREFYVAHISKLLEKVSQLEHPLNLLHQIPQAATMLFF